MKGNTMTLAHITKPQLKLNLKYVRLTKASTQEVQDQEKERE